MASKTWRTVARPRAQTMRAISNSALDRAARCAIIGLFPLVRPADIFQITSYRCTPLLRTSVRCQESLIRQRIPYGPIGTRKKLVFRLRFLLLASLFGNDPRAAGCLEEQYRWRTSRAGGVRAEVLRAASEANAARRCRGRLAPGVISQAKPF